MIELAFNVINLIVQSILIYLINKDNNRRISKNNLNNTSSSDSLTSNES